MSNAIEITLTSDREVAYFIKGYVETLGVSDKTITDAAERACECYDGERGVLTPKVADAIYTLWVASGKFWEAD